LYFWLAFAKARPDDAMHPYLHRLVSEKTFQKIKSGTKNWLIECMNCHHKRDFWGTGGLRGGGVGISAVAQHYGCTGRDGTLGCE